MAAGAAVPGFTRCFLPNTLSSGGSRSAHLQSLYGGVRGAAVPCFTSCLLPLTLSSGGSRSAHLPSLYGGARSSRLFSVSRFRDLEVEDVKLRRIDGAPPPSLESYDPSNYSGLDAGDPSIHSTLLSISTPVEVEVEVEVEAEAEALNGNENAHLILPRVDTKGLTYLTAHSVEDDGTLVPLYYIYPPSPINQNILYYFTGATSNGLFHFHSDKKRTQHYLWNATTNEVKTLPSTISGRQNIPVWQIVLDYAATCSSCDGDFKLMLLVGCGAMVGCYEDGCYYIELYSLKTNRWRYIHCEYNNIFCEYSVCINGVYYCVARETRGGEKYVEFILSFDCGCETFSTIPLPPDVSPSDEYHLLEYKGLLSAVAYSGLESVPSSYCSWVWENGVWIQLCHFRTCNVREPVMYSQDGRMLYFKSLKDELMVHDYNAGHLKRLGIHCFSREMQLSTLVQNHVRLNVEEVEKEKDDEGMPEVENEEDFTDVPWLQSMIDRQTSEEAYIQYCEESREREYEKDYFSRE